MPTDDLRKQSKTQHVGDNSAKSIMQVFINANLDLMIVQLGESGGLKVWIRLFGWNFS